MSELPISTHIGPYELVHRIAVGGMAEVHRALAPQVAGDRRAVVIKRLLPNLVDEEMRAMFDEEARLGRLLEHPNVVQVLGLGEDDDRPYIVLEYVFGVDLSRLSRWLTRNGGPMQVPLALFVASEMLAGLEAVHAVRDAEGNPLMAVHRDVSPSNVFLSVHGDVKLGDLGIARLLQTPKDAPRPQAVRARGKLGYLAPEQIGASEIDQRADVFSAAVVAVELLMGQPLFAGATELGILLAIRDGDLLRFERHAESLPEGLAEVLFHALAKSPADRMGSVRELRERLAPFVLGSPERLRDDLGALVTEVLDSGEQAIGAVDRASLAQTVEGPMPSSALDEDTSAAAFEETEMLGGAALAAAAIADAPAYELLVTGATEGVQTYAGLVRGIVAQQIGPADLVKKDGADARPVSAFPELARHLPPSSRTPTSKVGRKMAKTSETYALDAPFGILQIFSRAFILRETGLYLCERGPVRKEVYIANGQPVYVTSNQPHELLGEYLVRRGVLDRAELDMALAVMPRFEGKLGDSLIALGLVEPLMLVRHLTNKVREQLLDTFSWADGRVSFYRDAAPPDSTFNLGFEVWTILDAGAKRRVSASLDGDFFQDCRNGVVRVVREDAMPLLPPPLATLLYVLTQPRTLEELVRHGDDEGRVLQGLLVLGALGAIRPA